VACTSPGSTTCSGGTAAWSTTSSRRSLGLPLEGAEDYLAAEVVYAVSHEGARHLDDVLTRRTRISIETFDRGVSAAPAVAALMAEELGWDAARSADEVDHYLRRVEAERQSQLMPTDQEADEARVVVRDIV
jgi:glycerol-3-phosphate dehydrogenase